MPKHILSVSYNERLLLTRELLLQREGYAVTSALGFTEAVKHCKAGPFDLFILGHSIPENDKRELVHLFSQSFKSPVLALQRHGENIPDGAEFHAHPDDIKGLLQTVGKILSERTAE